MKLIEFDAVGGASSKILINPEHVAYIKNMSPDPIIKIAMSNGDHWTVRGMMKDVRNKLEGRAQSEQSRPGCGES